jgi:5-methylcytosine-specific restriction endonuclease McrA
MKNKPLNLKRIWIQFEDHLAPRLGFSLTDRAVYSHLFRHSRLVGKCRLRFSIAWLGRGTRLCDGPVRAAVRRLVGKGALRLIERSKAGHLVEVRLPEEIRGFGAHNIEGGNPARAVRAANIEEVDFLKTKALRQAIHAREHGLCFYCQRRTSADKRCLDHVVSLVNLGGNSYRNLVSCCVECNSKKGEMAGADFLLWLYREGRLTANELTGRLRALEALAAGKLRPPVQRTDSLVSTAAHTLGHGGRPTHRETVIPSCL